MTIYPVEIRLPADSQLPEVDETGEFTPGTSETIQDAALANGDGCCTDYTILLDCEIDHGLTINFRLAGRNDEFRPS